MPVVLRRAIPALVFVVALTLYVVELSSPPQLVFDEKHYAGAAALVSRGEIIDPSSNASLPFNAEHPPLAKYLMALGYEVAGRPHSELGAVDHVRLCREERGACAQDLAAWRAPGAVVAAAGVVGLYWTGLRLFGRLAAGLSAAALLLLDPFYYVHARLAFLDIYAVGFGLLAFGAYLGPGRRHRWVGALCFGLAVSSKLSALFLLPPFLLLAYYRSDEHRLADRLRAAARHAVLVPLAVYLAAYGPHWVAWLGDGGPVGAASAFVSTQALALGRGYGGDVGASAFQSPPWAWILLRDPILYDVDAASYAQRAQFRVVYSLGNPVTWWLGAGLALGWLAAAARRIARTGAPGWRARLGAAAQAFRPDGSMGGRGLAGLLVVSAYAPFFLLARGQFIFYFVLVAPFLSLALAGGLAEWGLRGGGPRVGAVAVIVGAALAFWFYFPAVSADPLSRAGLERIMDAIPWMRWR